MEKFAANKYYEKHNTLHPTLPTQHIHIWRFCNTTNTYCHSKRHHTRLNTNNPRSNKYSKCYNIRRKQQFCSNLHIQLSNCHHFIQLSYQNKTTNLANTKRKSNIPKHNSSIRSHLHNLIFQSSTHWKRPLAYMASALHRNDTNNLIWLISNKNHAFSS